MLTADRRTGKPSASYAFYNLDKEIDLRHNYGVNITCVDRHAVHITFDHTLVSPKKNLAKQGIVE